jgi:uncharacterized protein (TIGR02271 family)
VRHEKIVTLFDTAEHADIARRNLEKAGFSGQDISIVGRNGLASDVRALREPNLWHKLFGRDVADYEAKVYGRTVEDGGAVLTLRTEESDLPKAMGILNQHHIVDVKRRAMEMGLKTPSEGAPTALAELPARPLTTEIDKGEVLRLAEEQLEVGKRLVTEGTTRIRRFVIEKPVEAQVTLHEEHVEIVRRAVSTSASPDGVDWAEKTIEIIDTHEEPVLSKSAHIAEEVRIDKKATDRVETIREQVRRQDVKVERVPLSAGR